MPSRAGVAKQNGGPLNPAQTLVLDAIQNDEGWNAGIATTYHEALRRMNPATAPTRDQVREYLMDKPDYQVNQVPRQALAVAPFFQE